MYTAYFCNAHLTDWQSRHQAVQSFQSAHTASSCRMPHLISQEAVVHKHAVQPLPEHLVHEHCCHGAVHPSGECTDDMVLRPNLQSSLSQKI